MNCPSCQKLIPDESVFCSHCGYDLVHEKTSRSEVRIKGRDVFIGGSVVGRDYNIYNVTITSGNGLLNQLWDKMAPELQMALLMAHSQGLGEGHNRIKTRNFFSALLRLRPEPLSELFSLLPAEAFPDPTEGQILSERLMLQENPLLSACIEDSLRHLGARATDQDKLTSADVFVDIAKFGTGNSVSRLRTYGITPDKIDQLIQQLGWQII